MYYFLGKATTQGQSQTQRKEDLLLAEAKELKKLHEITFRLINIVYGQK